MERKADRGAWSMELRTERPTRRHTVRASPDGIGSNARNIDEGRWVNTMAWIKPRRLARLEAKTLPSVDTHLFSHQSMARELGVTCVCALPCCRHDAAQLALWQVELTFHVVVDQTERNHPGAQGIQEEQAAELDESDATRL